MHVSQAKRLVRNIVQRCLAHYSVRACSAAMRMKAHHRVQRISGNSILVWTRIHSQITTKLLQLVKCSACMTRRPPNSFPLQKCWYVHDIWKPCFWNMPAITLQKNSFQPARFVQNSTINTTPSSYSKKLHCHTIRCRFTSLRVPNPRKSRSCTRFVSST